MLEDDELTEVDEDVDALVVVELDEELLEVEELLEDEEVLEVGELLDVLVVVVVVLESVPVAYLRVTLVTLTRRYFSVALE